MKACWIAKRSASVSLVRSKVNPLKDTISRLGRAGLRRTGSAALCCWRESTQRPVAFGPAAWRGLFQRSGVLLCLCIGANLDHGAAMCQLFFPDRDETPIDFY